MFDSDQSRNGPPDAVKMRRRQPPAGWVEHLEDRVVLGIDRQQRAAADSLMVSHKSSPAQTSASLLASATMRAAPGGHQGRRQAGIADDAAITHSAGRDAASMTASGPAAASIDVPASASLRAR